MRFVAFHRSSWRTGRSRRRSAWRACYGICGRTGARIGNGIRSSAVYDRSSRHRLAAAVEIVHAEVAVVVHPRVQLRSALTRHQRV